jgi:hypothetical protein
MMIAVRVACIAVAAFTMIIGILMFASKLHLEAMLVILIAFCLVYLSDELGSE